MIRGAVNAQYEAVVRLRLRGPSGTEFDVDAIVDSGFTAFLSLPVATVTALGLIRQSASAAVLADGSVKNFDVYAADIEWDGNSRPVLISAVGNEALMGMRLLTGYELRIEVLPGGTVEISPMPP